MTASPQQANPSNSRSRVSLIKSETVAIANFEHYLPVKQTNAWSVRSSNNIVIILHTICYVILLYQPPIIVESKILMTSSPRPSSEISTCNPIKTNTNNDETPPNQKRRLYPTTTKTNTASPFNQHFLSSLLAGVGSGSLASIVCAPLDLVRTRMQVIGGLSNPAARLNPKVLPTLYEIYLSDGIRGCFRGLGITLATVPAFWGLYFPLYEYLKFTMMNRNDGDNIHDDDERGHRHRAAIHLGSAVLAGAVADVVCNPMFVVRTRMQTEALHYFQVPKLDRMPHGLLATLRGLYAEGGVPIFWRGLSASLLGLGHVGIQFPMYERLKAEARSRSKDGVESPLDLLLASGLSKMMAAVITYPHEVVRSRMMDARVDSSAGGRGVVGTFRHIVRTEGYPGLYVGLRVTLIRVVPNCCVTFVSYELIARWVRGYLKERNGRLGPWQRGLHNDDADAKER